MVTGILIIVPRNSQTSSCPYLYLPTIESSKVNWKHICHDHYNDPYNVCPSSHPFFPFVRLSTVRPSAHLSLQIHETLQPFCLSLSSSLCLLFEFYELWVLLSFHPSYAVHDSFVSGVMKAWSFISLSMCCISHSFIIITPSACSYFEKVLLTIFTRLIWYCSLIHTSKYLQV